MNYFRGRELRAAVEKAQTTESGMLSLQEMCQTELVRAMMLLLPPGGFRDTLERSLDQRSLVAFFWVVCRSITLLVAWLLVAWFLLEPIFVPFLTCSDYFF